jgi:hypothetical protein
MITPSFAITATERVLPKLALDFTTATLDSRITFTRATSASNPATYVNSSGVITSATDNAPRFDHNPLTFACRGLLIEESRVNSFTYSEDFTHISWVKFNSGAVTGNQAVAPDGTTTADLLEWTSANASGIYKSINTGTNKPAMSVFAKYVSGSSEIILQDDSGARRARFNLLTGVATGLAGFSSVQMMDYGNGWYRCVLVFSSAPSSVKFINGNNVAGSCYIWGAQLEQEGAFATSYIPTEASALTRNADVATMTGTNFSDWFNATEGTFYTRSTILAGATNNRIAFIGDNTTSNYISAGPTGGNVVTGGNVQAAMTRTISNLGFYSSVTAYKANSFANSVNGDTPLTDSSGTVPTVSQMNIGSLISTGSVGSGHAIKIQYWPQRLTNAEVRAFSKG